MICSVYIYYSQGYYLIRFVIKSLKAAESLIPSIWHNFWQKTTIGVKTPHTFLADCYGTLLTKSWSKLVK